MEIISTARPQVPDELPEVSKPGMPEPVLLIHGTFANRFEKGKVDWWQPGSKFCVDLDAALQAEGSAARCWMKRGGKYYEPFAWTGDNLESARRAGGRALAAMLLQMENDPDVARYHLIAHSHGGNVVTIAMQELDFPPCKLGHVVTLGTPALKFNTGKTASVESLVWLALIALFAFSIWQLVTAQGDTAFTWIAIVTIAFMMVLEGIGLRRRLSNDAWSLYGSGQAHAFVFPGDEAIRSLITADEIIRHPKKFIDQFLAAEKASGYAVTPFTPPASRYWRDFQKSVPHVLMKTLLQRAQQMQPSPGLLNPTNMKLSGPLSPVDRQSTILNKVADLMISFPIILQAVVSVSIVCTGLVLFLIGTANVPRLLLERIVYLCKLMLAAISAVLAWVSLPSLIRKAAFGVDKGTFVSVSDRPPGVSELQPISKELRAEIDALFKRLGGTSGEAVFSGLLINDPFAIKSQIKAALTETDLVHSHYYQSAELRSCIAKLIANPDCHRISDPAIEWLLKIREPRSKKFGR